MLASFDELLNVNKDERKYWLPVVDGQVRTHHIYIKSILHRSVPRKDSIREAYSKTFLTVIDKIFDRIEEEQRHEEAMKAAQNSAAAAAAARSKSP